MSMILWILFILINVAYTPIITVRAIFIVIGWFFVPLTLLADGYNNTAPLWVPIYGDVADIPARAKKNFWARYVEMAWRNPTAGITGWFKQPIAEERPNPDQLVRNENRKSATRFMHYKWFWEFWYMRQIDWKIGSKHYRWFEFRTGWKFADGTPGFTPTFQLGPRSS